MASLEDITRVQVSVSVSLSLSLTLCDFFLRESDYLEITFGFSRLKKRRRRKRSVDWGSVTESNVILLCVSCVHTWALRYNGLIECSPLIEI